MPTISALESLINDSNLGQFLCTTAFEINIPACDSGITISVSNRSALGLVHYFAQSQIRMFTVHLSHEQGCSLFIEHARQDCP